MKKIITLILILITIAGYSQDSEKISKRELKKMQKELNEMNTKTNTDMVIISPKLVDEFIESIKLVDFDKLWDMVDEDIKEMQSKEDMIKIFGLYNTYFGQLINYEQTAFGMKTNNVFGQLATVEYDIEIGKYKGKANGMFKVYDKNTVKMFSFNISLDDYTTVDTLDNIARPSIEAIKAKDKKQIYNLTSNRFKEYTSIADFESRINKILDIDIMEIKMFRVQFGTKDGNEIIVIYYELNEKGGYLQLSFTRLTDTFELEGLSYTPNK